jgi:hypothetical protein
MRRARRPLSTRGPDRPCSLRGRRDRRAARDTNGRTSPARWPRRGTWLSPRRPGSFGAGSLGLTAVRQGAPSGEVTSTVTSHPLRMAAMDRPIVPVESTTSTHPLPPAVPSAPGPAATISMASQQPRRLLPLNDSAGHRRDCRQGHAVSLGSDVPRRFAMYAATSARRARPSFMRMLET